VQIEKGTNDLAEKAQRAVNENGLKEVYQITRKIFMTKIFQKSTCEKNLKNNLLPWIFLSSIIGKLYTQPTVVSPICYKDFIIRCFISIDRS
jgi:hypothetical protein